MIKEYDVVRLTRAIPEHGLALGTQGAVVLVHNAAPPHFEVEFCDPSGRTIALLTLGADAIQRVVDAAPDPALLSRQRE